MIKKLLLPFLFLFIFSCNQENQVAEIGKPVPDYIFDNILNSDQSSISLDDLKGKTVILEFWATWCGPCIPAMNKLDSMQKEFKNELEVIAISTENKERLEKYIKTSNTSLKVVSDTAHQVLFKYKVIPHVVIIDKNGIVRAITEPNNINKNVLHHLIANNEIDLDLKDDFYIDPNLEVKTIASDITSDYRIELKGYDQEQRGGYKTLRNPDGTTKGIELWNSTIPRLYQTIFDVASPSRMIYKDSLSSKDFPYEPEQQYNFLIEFSEAYQNNWRELCIEFLNENFEINARMGIDSMACYVLKNVDNTIEESKAGNSEYSFMGTILKTKMVKMTQLTEYLENFTPIPVVDQTNLTGEYDIELDWQAEDPKTLHTELKKYGLKLEKSEGKLPVEVMEIYRKNENVLL